MAGCGTSCWPGCGWLILSWVTAIVTVLLQRGLAGPGCVGAKGEASAWGPDLGLLISSSLGGRGEGS